MTVRKEGSKAMLKERIEILKSAGVISKETADFVCTVIDELEAEGKFSEKVSEMEMFTTHLAMATQRTLDQAEVECLDDFIWEDVQTSEVFALACDMYEQITAKAPCTFPDGERRFLVMHLCNLNQ